MPIKLVHSSNDMNPMEVTLDDFEQAVTDFDQHYYLEGGSSEFSVRSAVSQRPRR